MKPEFTAATGFVAYRGTTTFAPNILPVIFLLMLTCYGSNGFAQNTKLGTNALLNVTTGNYNTALGYQSQYNLTTGYYNTATGAYTSYLNKTGNGNTANGYASLYYNTGNYNKADGYYALYRNTTGSYNTGIGANALYNNTTAYYNTATGSSALYKNTSGNGNVATGYSSLYNNTTGGYNKAGGSYALYSNTTGFYNTGLGADALYSNATGSYNTAVGYASLYSNKVSANTAIGYFSLFYDTTGTGNTANGYYSLFSNRNGSYNKADGHYALYSNTSGWYNTALGANALYSNTTAYGNTATGYNTLYNNTTGRYNKANGYYTLYSNTTGYYNSADALYALYKNTSGNGNTAAGGYALYSNTTGSYNKADGYYALYNNTTGNYNTALGAFADVSQGGFTNATAIGYNAIVDKPNKVRIGNTSVTSIGGQVGWSTFSDGRFKKDIKEDVHGLDFINSLRPVTYTLDVKNLSNYYSRQQKEVATNQLPASPTLLPDANDVAANAVIKRDLEAASRQLKNDAAENARTMKGARPSLVPELKNAPGMPSFTEAITAPAVAASALEIPEAGDDALKAEIKKAEEKAARVVYTGFVAQEVEESAKKLNYDFSGVDKPETKDGLYGLRYEAFIMPLVKSVQQLSQQNQDLQKQIDELKVALKNGSTQKNVSLSDAFIGQNLPNPFTKTTSIQYSLPAKYSVAQIMITDQNGKTLKQMNVSGTGKGTVNIDAAVLSQGTYNYSLFIDGQLISTRQMLLSK